MSVAADAAIDRWMAIVTGETTRGPLRASNIVVNGDKLYSYGTHFELARPLRDRAGGITAYLLNGDTYSVTTSAHQTHVRYVVGQRPEPRVIIPHSALNSAGIDLDSVQVVHFKEDTWTTTHHRTTTFPDGAKWHKEDVTEYREPTEQDYADALEQAITDAALSWNRRVRRHEENPKLWQDPGAFVPPTREDIRCYGKHVKVGETARLFTGRGNNEITVTALETGETLYEWSVTRHWLGEALIRAKVTWTTRETCPECGGKATHPRVGDAWDTRCTICSRGWSSVQGTILKTHSRWAYYLSGFDHEEARPLYFFAELPRGSKPATVAEAYEALKPEPVKMAEQMNRPVFRQGDIFGVPMAAVDRKMLRAMKARIVKRKVPPIPEGERSVQVTLPYVLNTNHTATEVAYLPGGVTLARGTMYHDPQGRRADHARRRIGDGKAWHVVIKNTVPLSVRR